MPHPVRLVVLALLPGLAAVVHGQGTAVWTPIALSGQTAAGGGGAVFAGFGAASINKVGQVSFGASLSGAGVTTANNSGIWVGDSGGLALVVRRGALATGISGGGYFNEFAAGGGGNPDPNGRPWALLNDSGVALFAAITTAAKSGLWGGAGGAVGLVAADGGPAAGTGSGVVHSFYGGGGNPDPNTLPRLAFNGAGQVAFTTALAGSGVTSANNAGIWAGMPGGLVLVARKGSAAPGLPSVVYGGFANGGGGDPDPNTLPPVRINASGAVAFGAALSGSGITTFNDEAIWVGLPGGLVVAAREGTAAPGTSPGTVWRFSGSAPTVGTLPRPTLNDSGGIAFGARLSGAGVDSSNDTGLWAGAPGALALVARKGSAAAGLPGLTFKEFARGGGANPDPNGLPELVFNALGQVAFGAQVQGAGVTAANDEGLWAGLPGDLKLVVREGDPTPGTPSGTTFRYGGGANPDPNNLPRLALSGSGQFVFAAGLTGSGVDASNDFGLWGGTIGGPLSLLWRTGDTMDLGGGDTRTLATLALWTPVGGGQDGSYRSLNDAGQYVFHASFTDGSSGIFVGVVPEPVVVSLVVTQGTGCRTVTFAGVVGRTYRIQRTPIPLGSPPEWTTIATVEATGNGSLSRVDCDAAPESGFAYRIARP